MVRRKMKWSKTQNTKFFKIEEEENIPPATSRILILFKRAIVGGICGSIVFAAGFSIVYFLYLHSLYQNEIVFFFAIMGAAYGAIAFLISRFVVGICLMAGAFLGLLKGIFSGTIGEDLYYAIFFTGVSAGVVILFNSAIYILKISAKYRLRF